LKGGQISEVNVNRAFDDETVLPRFIQLVFLNDASVFARRRSPMSNDLESYLLPLERQLKLAALGCGYRIVDWVEEGSVPLVEGKTDKPAPWQPHLDDGDSRQLQIAMEIHLTFGRCSGSAGRVARVSCPTAGIPGKGRFEWEVPLNEIDTNETIRALVLLCAAYRMQKLLDPDNGSNVIVLRKHWVR